MKCCSIGYKLLHVSTKTNKNCLEKFIAGTKWKIWTSATNLLCHREWAWCTAKSKNEQNFAFLPLNNKTSGTLQNCTVTGSRMFDLAYVDCESKFHFVCEGPKMKNESMNETADAEKSSSTRQSTNEVVVVTSSIEISTSKSSTLVSTSTTKTGIQNLPSQFFLTTKFSMINFPTAAIIPTIPATFSSNFFIFTTPKLLPSLSSLTLISTTKYPVVTFTTKPVFTFATTLASISIPKFTIGFITNQKPSINPGFFTTAKFSISFPFLTTKLG